MMTTRVDFSPLREFRDGLAPRIQEAVAALNRLARADRPALGGFFDAEQTTHACARLQTDQVIRLRRLVWALMTAHEVATAILTGYETGEELGLARLQGAARMLVLDDRRHRMPFGSTEAVGDGPGRA